MHPIHLTVGLVALLLCASTPKTSLARSTATIENTSLAKSKKRKKKRKKRPSNQRTTPPPYRKPHSATPVTAPVPVTVDLQISRHTLPNGLRILLHPEPSLPSVAVTLAIHVAAASESHEQKGFANAIIQHLLSASPLDSVDVTTTGDMLLLTNLVPPAEILSTLWQQARRTSLSIDEQAFESLRLRLQGAGPVSPSRRAARLGYQGCWPYQHSAHGWTDDLQASSPAVLEQFRRLVISPSRMVISVSGRFVPSEVLQEITRIFGPFPSVDPLPAAPFKLPDQINQRVDVARSPIRTSQLFLYGWALPPAGHPDMAALQLAKSILRDRITAGLTTRSARFAKLPTQAKVKLSIEPRMGPSWMTLRVDFPSSVDMDRTRKVVDEALLDLSMVGPTAAEMYAAWQLSQFELLEALSDTSQAASILAARELLGVGAESIEQQPHKLFKANREQVRRAAQIYLTPIRRNLVERRGPPITSPPSNESTP